MAKKQIIIARSIVDEFGGPEGFFRRGTIATHLCSTSEEILDVHRALRADMIISCVDLPAMGGEQLCSAVRQDETLKKVSIIIVCEGTEISLEKCRSLPVNAVIPKPIDAVQLFSTISELLVVPRRKDMRALLRISVKGRQEKDTFFAMSSNISISGMLMETEQVLEKGQKFTCFFNIGHSEMEIECIVVRPEIMSSKRRRYGVRFLNCDTRSLIIIENFVKTQGRG